MISEMYIQGLKIEHAFDYEMYKSLILSENFDNNNQIIDHFRSNQFSSTIIPWEDFDAEFYGRLNPHVEESGLNPLIHYIEYGQYEGRRPSETYNILDILSEKGRILYDRVRSIVDRNYYFDQIEYLSNSDADPVLHYFSFGYGKGYSLVKDFDEDFYTSHNDDVRRYGLDPFLHYAQYGYLEGRRSSDNRYLLEIPLSIITRTALIREYIDADHYFEQLPWLRDCDVDLACHYIIFGEASGISPNRTFNPVTFSQQADVGKPNHLSWFEASLLGSGQIDWSNAHVEAEDAHGRYANVPLLSLLQRRNWPNMSRKQGFEAGRLQTRCWEPTVVQSTPVNANTGQEIPLARDNQPMAEAPEQSVGDAVDTMLVDRILSQSEGKILSCDIWDTVLRRDCAPDEVKLRAARAVWLLYGKGNSMLTNLHPVDLFQVRRIAEAEVSDDAFEFRHVDLVDEWLSLLKLPAAKISAPVIALETRIEKQVTSVDATAAAILKGFKGRKIAVSDFYLPKSALSDILTNRHGIEFDEYYISSDYLKTKRNGDLFAVVKEKEGVDGKDILHIGDRLHADVQIPRNQHGIMSELYNNSRHIDRNKFLDTTFWTFVDGDVSLHAANIFKICDLKETDATISAAALALPFAGFALHIIEQAIRGGHEHIFCFSREGSFFRRLCELAVEQDVFDIEQYPGFSMLSVSRRATFAASLEDLTEDQLLLIWNQYSSQSIAALARSLNIDVTLWAAAADRHGLALEEAIQDPWRDSRVQAFLRDPDIRQTGRASIWDQRARLLTYLEKAGFEPDKPIERMIVDIGWRGTIQDNLSRLVYGTIHGCYLGLDNYLNPQSVNTTKTGYLMNAPKREYFVIPEYAALEFLSNARGGSVIGYENGKPVGEIFDGEERIIEQYVEPIQEDLINRCREIFAYVKSHGLISHDLRDMAQLAVSRFMQSPEQRVADAFYALEHNETFGTGEVHSISEEEKLDATLADTGFALHHNAKQAILKLRWTQAFLNSQRYNDYSRSLSTTQQLTLPRFQDAVSAPPVIRRRGDAISIFAPTPIWGSGGHRTIYNFAKALGKAGHNVTLLSEGRGDAYGYKEQELGGSQIRMADRWSSASMPDAAIATIMYSARHIEEIFPKDVKQFYFVQDNEAEFNMTSDGYVVGENSFTKGHMHLCVGNWLPHMISSRFGGQAIGAGLGVDSTIYGPLKNAKTGQPVKRRNRIAFLYQPEKPRRLPSHCLEAIRIIKQERPDTEICVFGSHHRPDLPFEYEHLGLVDDLSQLNALYNSAKAGLCVSLTNPSRIPFEMMAGGCIPVNVYRYNNLFDHHDGASLLCFQSAQSLAHAILSILDESEEAFETRSLAARRIGLMRSLDWENDVLVNAFEAKMSGADLSTLVPPTISYKSEAFVYEKERNDSIVNFLAFQKMMATL